ncbi:MAG: hypothetical protein NTW83_08275 [Cyanobacteria bacterium]|nr:hypothetical protein [Cyanobacteriota bacterium]
MRRPAFNEPGPEVTTMAGARSCIEGTRALLTAIEYDDSRLEESKRTELDSGLLPNVGAALFERLSDAPCETLGLMNGRLA